MFPILSYKGLTLLLLSWHMGLTDYSLEFCDLIVDLDSR